MTRYAAQLTSSIPRHSRILSAGLFQAFSGSLLVAISLSLLSRPIAIGLFEVEDLAQLLHLAAIALPGAAVGKVVLGFLNGQRRMGAFMIVTALQSMATVACTVALVETGHGATGATLGLLIPAAVAGFASLIAVRRETWQGPSRVIAFPSFSPTLLRYGALVTLSNSIGLIQGYTDTVMIGAFLSETEVGLYAAAMLLLQFVLFPGNAARLVVTPRIAALWSKDEAASVQCLMERSLSAVAMIAVPSAFTIALSNAVLLPAIFGAPFSAAGHAIALLMPGAAVMGTWATTGATLGITGHVQSAFKLSLLSAAANIPLNAILIPHFGISGAALATTASLVVACILEAYSVHKRLGIRISWQRPITAGAVLITVAAWLLATDRQPGTLFGCVLWWFAATVLCLALQPSAMRRETIARIQAWLNKRLIRNSR
jgi:O-antigen/teichoic acid export membrane protein